MLCPLSLNPEVCAIWSPKNKLFPTASALFAPSKTFIKVNWGSALFWTAGNDLETVGKHCQNWTGGRDAKEMIGYTGTYV